MFQAFCYPFPLTRLFDFLIYFYLDWEIVQTSLLAFVLQKLKGKYYNSYSKNNEAKIH